MDDRAFRWLAPTVALACVLLTHAFGYEEEKGPRVDALFEAARNGPGAAVLVARDGDILFRKAYGLADVERGLPNTTETRFRLGSVTKPLTALAILRLESLGRLSIDDPVGRYLPDISVGDRVTLKHLLTHTSGLPDFLSYEEARESPLDFDPGERINYSNTGYFLLGRVIEAVSGGSYGDFLQEALFGPLGMTGSGLEREGMSGEGFAVGYRNSNDGVVGAPSGSVEGAYAAGGLYSTVEDLFLLNRALDAGDPIPEDSLRTAFTPARLTGGREVAYGFGWMISRHLGLIEIAHGGDITGFNAYIARYPDQRFAVFVLSNQEMRPPGPLPTAGDLAHRIAEIYLEEEMEAPQSALSVSVPDTLLQRYVGVYELEAPVPVVNVMGTRFTVTLEKGRLFGEAKTGKTELLAFSDTEFYVEGSPARLFFIADSEGRATELIFSFLGIREFRAVRVP